MHLQNKILPDLKQFQVCFISVNLSQTAKVSGEDEQISVIIVFKFVRRSSSEIVNLCQKVPFSEGNGYRLEKA